MRFLILTSRFSADHDRPELLQDLAEQLNSRGHDTDLIVLGQQTGLLERPAVIRGQRLRALVWPEASRPRFYNKGITKHIFAILKLYAEPRARAFLTGQYDACIFASPGLVKGGLPVQLKRANPDCAIIMYLWDFFPVANTTIGALRVPRIAEQLLKILEESLIRDVDALFLMSRANSAFLDQYYSSRISTIRRIQPPWGRDTEGTGQRSAKYTDFTVVWGGQMSAGRSLSDLIHVAAAPTIRRAGIRFLIAGDGPRRAEFERLAHSVRATNMSFLGQLTRPDYEALLSRCHVGVSLMEEMPVPTFPSKLVDYTKMGLPVLTSVESGTDVGRLIEDAGAGRSISSGDRGELAEAILDLAGNQNAPLLDEMSRRSRAFFEQQLDVAIAAERLEQLTLEVTG